MSAEEKNKALVHEFVEEAWVKGNVAAVDEFMAAEYVEHPRPSTLPPGTEGLKQLIAAYRTTFPDPKMTLDDIFGEGEMVAFRWSVSGTHLGDWLGILPTGNHVTATGITVFRIAGGKVAESWTSIDLSPAEEELHWLTQGDGGATSGDISLAERDTSPQIWDVLTRNLTWRLRVTEVQERDASSKNSKSPVRSNKLSCPRRCPSSTAGSWRLTTSRLGR
jgi:predicted ester cyclase